MNAERARRREEIATAALQGLLACPDVHGSPLGFAEDAIKFANALMAELDKAALADTPDADPVHETAAMQDMQEAKDAAANRSVAKSILIWQRDRQIADLEEQLAALERKVAALNEFVEGVLNEASKSPELYGPFVRLVRDLDAKVGAK